MSASARRKIATAAAGTVREGKGWEEGGVKSGATPRFPQVGELLSDSNSVLFEILSEVSV